jgi:hypothetical protein
VFKYSTDEHSGILHLTQVGRSTFEDFQVEMPGIIRCLQSGRYPNFLLEIEHLNEPGGYVDPDLAFGAINQIKIWISRMAIVCSAELSETVEPIAEIVRNHRKPVKKFSRVTDALRWLEQSE